MRACEGEREERERREQDTDAQREGEIGRERGESKILIHRERGRQGEREERARY